MGLKPFVAGMFAGVFMLVGCAAMFPYKQYGPDLPDYSQGFLRAPLAKDDLPFDRCAPTAAKPHPCVVMFADEPDGFYAMKNALKTCQMELKRCQRDCRTGD